MPIKFTKVALPAGSDWADVEEMQASYVVSEALARADDVYEPLPPRPHGDIDGALVLIERAGAALRKWKRERIERVAAIALANPAALEDDDFLVVEHGIYRLSGEDVEEVERLANIKIGAVAPDDREQRRSDRLSIFLAGGRPGFQAGPLQVEAASLGTPEDWAWSAVSYLKTALAGTQGGTKGGTVEVSAAAVGVLLGYVEKLAGEAGVIGGGDG